MMPPVHTFRALIVALARFLVFFFPCYRHHRDLHSFPTRRSSDLLARPVGGPRLSGRSSTPARSASGSSTGDRKSTRLNSSHLGISYAVFCLKKKRPFIDLGCVVSRPPELHSHTAVAAQLLAASGG